MRTQSDILGETERLFLRHPSQSDLEAIITLWTDPQVTSTIGGPRDLDTVVDFFRQVIMGPHKFAQEEGEWWWSIIERSTEKFVGLCSLLEKEIEGKMETDLGYFLLPIYWGQGYAMEAANLILLHAFTHLKLESLVAVIHPENAKSISVAQKLGMQYEREVIRSDEVIRHVYRLNHSSYKRKAG